MHLGDPLTWDHVILLQPAEAEARAAALAKALGVPGDRVHGVVEPPSSRRGNLGGTVHAWRALREVVATTAGRPARVLMLHDAGAASRSGAWAEALGGRRTDLPVPGPDGTLLPAILRGLAPLAASNPGGVVDVAWTSQLLALRANLPPPSADLTKLVARRAPVDDAAQRELGWFRLAGDRPVAMAPGRTFATHAALRAWLGDDGDAAVDVGSFRATAALLDRLAALPTDGLDLDPGLTHPLLDARAGSAPTPWVAALGPDLPTVGALDIGDSGWWRVRRARDVRDLLRDPAALAALGVPRPCVRATAGGVPLDALTPDELAAGVQIGGCWLRDVTLQDVELAPGSSLRGVTALRARGRIEARDAALLEVDGPLSATDALALRAGPCEVAHGARCGDRFDAW